MSTDPRGAMLLAAAVRSALAALDATSISASGDNTADLEPRAPGKADRMRIERYLSAALQCCPHLPAPQSESRRPIQAACRSLRDGDLTEAYLALHAAHTILSGR